MGACCDGDINVGPYEYICMGVPLSDGYRLAYRALDPGCLGRFTVWEKELSFATSSLVSNPEVKGGPLIVLFGVQKHKHNGS